MTCMYNKELTGLDIYACVISASSSSSEVLLQQHKSRILDPQESMGPQIQTCATQQRASRGAQHIPTVWPKHFRPLYILSSSIVSSSALSSSSPSAASAPPSFSMLICPEESQHCKLHIAAVIAHAEPVQITQTTTRTPANIMKFRSFKLNITVCFLGG